MMMSANEWDAEPELVDFTDDATGLDCGLRRGPMGHWCGYVRLPVGHPLHGVDYSSPVQVPDGYMDRETKIDEDYGAIALFAGAFRSDTASGTYPLDLAVRCHGGLTYAGTGVTGMKSDGSWWLGFDCAHSGDLCPKGSRHGGDVYRSVDYVKASLTKLCSDIAAIAPVQAKAA